MLSFAVWFLWFVLPLGLCVARWSGVAGFASIGYWIAYLVLTATKRWEEPYDFSVSKNRAVNDIAQAAFVLLFAVLFVFTSMALWENKS